VKALFRCIFGPYSEYAARGNPQVEAKIAEKRRFWTGTRGAVTSRWLVSQTANCSGHLTGIGEASNATLREHERPVDLDLEDAILALDEACVGVELVLQLGRQPGSPRLVVSDYAVLDGDIHSRLRLGQQPSNPIRSRPTRSVRQRSNRAALGCAR